MNKKNIKLNYFELAYLTGESERKVKEIFKKLSGKKNINNEIEIEKLKPFFRSARSLDPNYDGKNLLDIKIMLLQTGYTKKALEQMYLTHVTRSPGATIYEKICN